MLPLQLLPAFEGIFPSVLVTGSADSLPNIINLSRVWYIDNEHVAVANQMFNKTSRNLSENPLALIKIVNPHDLEHWEIGVKFIREEHQGPLFDRILEDIRTISWMAGVTSPVLLKSAMIFQVLSVRPCVEESLHLSPPTEAYGDLLKVLAQRLELSRSSFWLPAETTADGSLKLLASRGVPGAGTNEWAFEPMRRLATLVEADRRVIRLKNIRSQIKYVNKIYRTAEAHSSTPLPNSFLGFPIIRFDRIAGIICCEEMGQAAEAFERLDDQFLMLLSHKLGESIALIPAIEERERESLFKQVVERVKLEWEKAADPFHTTLSARERQVSLYVAKGHTNAEIAEILFISKRTVTTHVERIFDKLQVTSRTALTKYIVEKRLLTDEVKE